jgi:hypothetical protein
MDKTVRGIIEEEVRKGMNPSEDGVWRICPSVVADKILISLKALLKSKMPKKLRLNKMVTKDSPMRIDVSNYVKGYNQAVDRINQVIDEI